MVYIVEKKKTVFRYDIEKVKNTILNHYILCECI